jgi:hypothetical protein
MITRALRNVNSAESILKYLGVCKPRDHSIQIFGAVANGSLWLDLK